MARASTKENKNIYFRYREQLGLTREEASETLGGLTADRIEKIENERSLPHPDEVLLMAEGYKAPQLCNYYCANECPIGQQYVPEIQVKDLSRIVLEMLAALNVAQKQITADGEIQTDEISDFVEIQKTLERISVTVETLQLWSEQMLASGAINRELYEKYMSK